MSNDREQVIRERAFSLWETDGRPLGRDADYWSRAEQLVAAEEAVDAPSMTDIPPL
ncbi:MAG: DUF2934 domain-containing protein [Oxalobacteraceae bacterium]|nr:MAG: DUF2934 domain-containing protein [Oxalobacteraceae bacterium]